MGKNQTNTPPDQEVAEPTLLGLRHREFRMIAIVICIKALLFLFAIQSYQVLQNQRVEGARGWREIWNRWDALNYQKLAEFGYSARPIALRKDVLRLAQSLQGRRVLSLRELEEAIAPREVR